MIQAVVVHDAANAVLPWWKDVPFLKGIDRIAFGPGVTIIFGPNGSGKSTVLTTIAKMLCAWQGGVSMLTESAVRDLRGSHGKLRDGVLPEHDGRGIRYVDPSKSPGAFGGAAFDDDFLMQQVQDKFATRASAGQVTVARMQPIFGSLNDPKSVPKPNLTFASRDMNDIWQADVARISEIMQGTATKGAKIPTLLLDEPDRSLSIPWTANMWENVRKNANPKKIQIIAATHSPFALDLPGVTYIETEPGYLDQCRRVYREVGARIG